MLVLVLVSYVIFTIPRVFIAPETIINEIMVALKFVEIVCAVAIVFVSAAVNLLIIIKAQIKNLLSIIINCSKVRNIFSLNEQQYQTEQFPTCA